MVLFSFLVTSFTEQNRQKKKMKENENKVRSLLTLITADYNQETPETCWFGLETNIIISASGKFLSYFAGEGRNVLCETKASWGLLIPLPLPSGWTAHYLLTPGLKVSVSPPLRGGKDASSAHSESTCLKKWNLQYLQRMCKMLRDGLKLWFLPHHYLFSSSLSGSPTFPWQPVSLCATPVLGGSPARWLAHLFPFIRTGFAPLLFWHLFTLGCTM